MRATNCGYFWHPFSCLLKLGRVKLLPRIIHSLHVLFHESRFSSTHTVIQLFPNTNPFSLRLMNYLHSPPADTISFWYLHFERITTDYEHGQRWSWSKHFSHQTPCKGSYYCSAPMQFWQPGWIWHLMTLKHYVYQGEYIAHVAAKTRLKAD